MNKPFVESLDENSGHQPLLTGSPQTGGMRSGRVSLLPGQDCGEHSTEENEEMLIFLSGHGRAIIDKDKILEVGKGKITYIPPQTVHNIKNTSNTPLSYIYCVSPVNGSSFDKTQYKQVQDSGRKTK
jgi:mannose-6-phosphate isomerase-like protein (cupin superfamily)